MAIPVGEEKTLQVKDGFVIKIIIDESDYEPDCTSLRIISSFNSAYPIFLIKLNLKPYEVITNKILGQDTIHLIIDFLDPNGASQFESFAVDLLYLSGEFDYPISNQLLSSESAIQDQCPFTVRAVPVDAYKVMTSTINKIYVNTSPIMMFQHLLNKAFDDSGVDMEKNILQIDAGIGADFNDTIIDQVIFPPTILKNHFDYLLNEFGLYKGFGVIYSSISENDNKIIYKAMNLNHRLISNIVPSVFKIIQLANDMDNDEIINNFEAGEYQNYYTYNTVHTNYIANTVFSNIGDVVFYVHKPIDILYRIDNVMPEEYADDSQGMLLPSTEPYINEDGLRLRKKYIPNHICHTKNETDSNSVQDEYWVSNQLGKSIFNLAQLSTTLERNLPLHVFTNIGEPVIFESNTSEYGPLNGKYILFSTDITFIRKSSWQTVADIQLVRPNWEE